MSAHSRLKAVYAMGSDYLEDKPESREAHLMTIIRQFPFLGRMMLDNEIQLPTGEKINYTIHELLEWCRPEVDDLPDGDDDQDEYIGHLEDLESNIASAVELGDEIAENHLVHKMPVLKEEPTVFRLVVDPKAKLGAANTSCPARFTVEVKAGEVIGARLGGFEYSVSGKEANNGD